MDSHDRYVLAIAMLDGDRDARKVLADLLEEQGERGLAQWARQGKNRSQQRASFAMMLLPFAESIRVGAGILEYAFRDHFHTEEITGSALLIDQWIRGDRDNVSVLAGLHGKSLEIRIRQNGPMWRSDDGQIVPAASIALETLIDAVKCAIEAENFLHEDSRMATHFEAQAKHCVRRVVGLVQRIVGLPIHWQTEYLKQAFEHLLFPATHPWPK